MIYGLCVRVVLLSIVISLASLNEESLREYNRGLSLDVADARTVVIDGDASKALVSPGLAPAVFDEPVVEIQMSVVAIAHNCDCRVDRGIDGGALG